MYDVGPSKGTFEYARIECLRWYVASCTGSVVVLLLVKERLVLLDLSLVNGSVCHSLGSIAGCCDRHRQEKKGRKSLQESIPRHLWKISGWEVLGALCLWKLPKPTERE